MSAIRSITGCPLLARAMRCKSATNWGGYRTLSPRASAIPIKAISKPKQCVPDRVPTEHCCNNHHGENAKATDAHGASFLLHSQSPRSLTYVHKAVPNQSERGPFYFTCVSTKNVTNASVAIKVNASLRQSSPADSKV